MKAQDHIFLDFSNRQRLFITTDIHGEYQMLTDELEKVDFNSDKDVLIIAGDLADRGPHSEASLEWIKKSWVYRVLGNHDVAPRLYLEGQLTQYLIEENFGGRWFTKLKRKDIEEIASAFENAPLVLTLLTPKGRRVGVAHADCTQDWDTYITSLHKPSVYDLTLWSRNTIDNLIRAQNEKRPFDPFPVWVKNIDHVFHGHTVLAEPFTIANRSWIDTGACFGGKLSLINVDYFLDSKERA